jgi:hypothetical protein
MLGWPRGSAADVIDVDYIVVDLKSPHFFYGPYSTFVPPNEALPAIIASKRYGIVAYADGVLVLKKGYEGSPINLLPYNENFNYKNFAIFPARAYIGFEPSSQSGRIIIHDTHHLNGTIWYGPYFYLFTGEYSATFRLKTKSENLSIVLDVVAWNGPSFELLVNKSFTANDFITLDAWQDFTLNFSVNGLKRVELRGTCLSNNTYLALDFVEVNQIIS